MTRYRVRPIARGGSMQQARDFERVIEMGMEFLKTTRFGTFIQGTPEQIGALAFNVMQMGEIFVAECDEDLGDELRLGALVGFLAIAKLPHPLAGRPYGDEVAWWVDPAHRKAGVGTMLLEHAEAWCRENGAFMVKMVAPVGSAIGTFYKTRGYTAVETAYQKDLT